MNRTVLAAFAAIAIAVSLPSQAQKPVYKYVYPDGRIVYADKPVPGAKLDTQVEVPPPPSISEPAPKPRVEAGAKPPAQDDRAKALGQAWEELRLSQQELDTAKAKLESGREPVAGDRTGTATGGSRLNDAYWARQKANEAAVDAAEARVRKAQDTVNRLR